MWLPKRIQHPRQSIGHGRKLQKTLDQEKEYSGLPTNLSKSFDCLPHDLIVAKLHAYCFFPEPLKLINSYLIVRKHMVKKNDQFSS